MRILNWYVTKNFVSTFLMAILILTFGMTGTYLMKLVELLDKGVSVLLVLQVLLNFIPISLAFTIPWASLVSIMLVFGRMSADNEITAMRASGVSILQITAPIIVATFVFTCLSLYLQLEVGPRGLGNGREATKNIGVKYPVILLSPGVAQEIDHKDIYIESKDSQGNIYGVQIYILDDDGSIRQDIVASRGKIETNEAEKKMDIVLYDATLSSVEGDGPLHLSSKESRITFDYGKVFNQKSNISRRDKFLTVREIFARCSILKKLNLDTTELEVELNQRVALALAPIAFLMLGLPLAIRTNRRETSIGLALSVLLAGMYYGGILFSDALSDQSKWYPQYLLWLPALLYQSFGLYYLLRLARK